MNGILLITLITVFKLHNTYLFFKIPVIISQTSVIAIIIAMTVPIAKETETM